MASVTKSCMRFSGCLTCISLNDDLAYALRPCNTRPRKQAKHEYIANRRWDKWSVTLKNEIQDRQMG